MRENTWFIPLMAANYDEAIAILKKRFENTKQIINKHNGHSDKSGGGDSLQSKGFT